MIGTERLHAFLNLLASLVVLSVGCGAHTGAAATATAKRPGHLRKHTSVRDVPWMNRAYDFGDGQTHQFVRGRYSELDETGNCVVCQVVLAVSFGDVDRNGSEDAIVLTNTNLGGAGHLTRAFVFQLVDGAPTIMAEIEGGDRGEGGLESVSVEAGLVVVRRFNSLPADGACCPSQVLVETWRWQEGRIVKRDDPLCVERRERKRWSLPR